MHSDYTKELHFDGNHKAISPSGAGNTTVTPHAVRRWFTAICDYNGPGRHMDPPDFAPALGSFVVLLMESKCREIFKRHCNGLRSLFETILGNDWVKRAINNWSTGSLQALASFDKVDYKPHDCGMDHLNDLDDLLRVFFYLHVDSYNSGMFQHDPLDPEPRTLTWDRVDEEIGDGYTFVPEEPQSHGSGHVSCRGAPKRKSTNTSESHKGRKRRKGLCGGGLGGPPEFPAVFMDWLQADNVKYSCDNLISHLASMGLEVLASKREPISWPFLRLRYLEARDREDDKPQEMTKAEQLDGMIAVGISKQGADPLSTSRNSEQLGDTEAGMRAYSTCKKEADPPTSINSESEKLGDLEAGLKMDGTPNEEAHAPSPSIKSISLNSKSLGRRYGRDFCAVDLESLRPGQFISDLVIHSAFKNLSSKLRRRGINDVLLAAPTLQHVICNIPQPAAARHIEPLQLATKRIVLFPINNNDYMDRADGGSHWSLLVLDQWTQHRPRLIHYDSAGGANVHRARHLAAVLQPYLTANTKVWEGITPQQDNGYDCGMYLIDIARVICSWCEANSGRGADTGEQEDWAAAILNEVNAKSVQTLRNVFYRNLEKDLSENPH